MEPPLESPIDEVTRLRECLTDLRGIVTQPALWAGGEPPRIVSTSLNALLGIASELEERFAQRTRELVVANEALREGERESRLVVDSIPGFIAAFTSSGELEFVNRPIFDYFGKTLEELKTWGTGGMTHPEDLPRVVELFTRSIASGDPFEVELRARRFDGVYRWFQSRGFPLRDANGRIVRWYNLLIDIDERKRAEEALRLSEARKTAILDSALDCIVTIDHEGGITEFNPAAERTFG